MKTITIPGDIAITLPDGSVQSVGLVKNLLPMWLNDRAFGESVGTLRQALKIEQAFIDKSPGERVHLEDADYALLRRAIETPAAPYIPALARYALPIFDAVLSAG